MFSYQSIGSIKVGFCLLHHSVCQPNNVKQQKINKSYTVFELDQFVKVNVR
ncbi:hypothetical protein TUM4249_23310 [Shewanella sp. KT0246]|nr:hypothetical protein TUM4249_23310 [Shewanella sp. KT0246]